ncbi:EamA family transporter [Candidatus Woesearchaeota archaeon]|nr:EamA family transporter [Candidatus Woesearchaeota archaeon]
MKDKITPGPVIEVLIAGFIFGGAAAVIKYLAMPPTSLTFIRLGIPTLFLLVWFFFSKQKIVKPNQPLIWASLLNSVRMVLYFVAIMFTTITNAIIVLYTYPIFVYILSIAFLKEKVSLRNLGLTLLAFIGIIFIYYDNGWVIGQNDLIGITAMLASSFIYSITVVIFKKQRESYDSINTLFYQNLVGAVVFLPFIFINTPPTAIQLPIAIFYAIMVGLVAFGLFFKALKHIKASTASTLLYVEVLAAIILAIIFFQEKIDLNTFIGGSMILLSTILLKKK